MLAAQGAAVLFLRGRPAFGTRGKGAAALPEEIAARGCAVTYLKRVRIGGLRLDPTLPKGGVRPMTQAELDLIFAP